MKNTILLILVTVILNLMLVSTGKAQTSTAPLGAGTVGDPYQIATLNNLYWLTQTTAAWASGKYFIQTADIDASTSNTWASGLGFTRIGNNTTKFSGNYNGGGYKIDGLFINRTTEYYVGLFGYTQSATISNLGVTNINITSLGYSGGLVGNAGTGTTITNCYVSGTNTATSNGCSGLFVGQNTGTIQYSCAKSGTVSGTGGSWGIGGFVGVNYSGGVINYCFSNSNAVCGNQQGAGFVGRNGLNGSATISNCYSTGSSSGKEYSGGFVGSNSAGSITNCYNTGLFTYYGSQSNSSGGFCGSNSATISNCFWDTQTSGQATSQGGTGKTTAQMKTQSTFTDATWNFTTIWNLNAIYNSSYPILVGFTYSPDPNTWSGAISTDWNNTGNWSYNSLPTSTDNITIPNVTNKPIIGNGNTGSARNITINTGSSLTVNGTLNLYGSVTNSGTFTTSSGTVNFTGSSAQNTTGLSGNFGSVTINNASGVSLTSNTSVSGTLTLTSGILSLGSYNLTIGSGAVISGTPSASNMVVTNGTGELRKVYTGTDMFEFPVGDNTGTAEYSPVVLGFNSGIFSSAYVGVQVTNGKYSNNASTTNYLNRYWTITPSGISNFDYALQLNYVAADVVGSETDLWCGKYSSGSWMMLSQAEPDLHQFTMLSITSFSTFTGGEQSVMPVSLSSFTSNVSGQNVNLKWTTSSETNNTGFNIERKTTETEWSKIGFVSGKGTTNTQTTYTYTDSKLNTGKYQYRLKQIDNNGNFEYHSLNGEVEVGVPAKFELSQNYPNPFNPTTKIDYQLPENSKITLKIFDITGREVMSVLNNESRTAGYYTLSINASSLSSGVYFYKVVADKYTQVKKMVVMK